MTVDTQALPEINRERINSMRSDIADIKRKLCDINAVLDGTNGDGLKTKVSKLQDRVDLLLKIAWATFATIWATIIVAVLNFALKVAP